MKLNICVCTTCDVRIWPGFPYLHIQFQNIHTFIYYIYILMLEYTTKHKSVSPPGFFAYLLTTTT